MTEVFQTWIVVAVVAQLYKLLEGKELNKNQQENGHEEALG